MKKFLLFLLLIVSFKGYCQRMDSVKYNHGYLYYHEYGSGEPIIILTGGPGSSYLQMEHLATNIGKNYRSILLEQRGTGRSIPTPFDSTTINLEAAEGDISLLLDHLKLKEATLVGHSWGGMLGMSYASKYPSKVKSLILLDPGPYKMDPIINSAFQANKELRLGGPEIAKRDSLSKKVKANTATKDEVEELQRLHYLPIVYHRNKLDSLSKIITKGDANLTTSYLIIKDLVDKRFDLTESLPSLKKPIHIISGRQDPGGFVSYEINLLVPSANLYWIERAGHFPMLEQPEEFYRTLFSILK